MSRLTGLITLASILFAGATMAEPCLYDTAWECELCGTQETINYPFYCRPANATFDDLTAGQDVGTYISVKWDGFAVGTGLLPAVSGHNYASFSLEAPITITFDQSGGVDPVQDPVIGAGVIQSFYFACFENGRPYDCSFGWDYYAYDPSGIPTQGRFVLSYNASASSGGWQWSGHLPLSDIEYPTTAIYNYTMVPTFGGDVLIDNVLFWETIQGETA